jgi:hypothetical protein
MYRHRLRQQVLYGHFREYIEILEALNDLARERGWTESTLWTPTVGASNEVIVETEFPDLATFQRENEAFYSDAEVMKHVRRLGEHVVQGSVYDELIEQAPHIA